MTMLQRSGTATNRYSGGSFDRSNSLKIIQEEDQDSKVSFDDQMRSFIDSRQSRIIVRNLEDFMIEDHNYFNGQSAGYSNVNIRTSINDDRENELL